MLRLVAFTGLLVVCPSIVSAQTIRMVDDDGQASVLSCDDSTSAFQNPRDAITSAENGDSVLVCPGTYVNPLNATVRFVGKTLTVRSTHGPSVTILDGNHTGSVVTFDNGGEGRDAVLEGFTIQNGRRLGGPEGGGGGGIRVSGASPTIRGNIIRNNGACPGGGIYIINASPLVEDNTISDNSGQTGCISSRGGGVGVNGTSEALIRRNTIADNDGSHGGGVSIAATGAIRLEGNIISGNRAPRPGGIYSPEAAGALWVGLADGLHVGSNLIINNDSSAVAIAWRSTTGMSWVVNNTIANNQSADGYAVYFGASTSTWVNNLIVAATGQKAIWCTTTLPPFRFNNVLSDDGSPYGPGCGDATGTNGNILADPHFVDAAAGNYRLQPDSPNIEAGEHNVPGQPGTDLDRRARVLDGNADGIPVVDIGAYELGLHPRDLNADGRMDLIFQHQAAGALAVWAMDDVTRSANVMLDPSRVGPNWWLAGSGDFNADGRPDLLWQERNDGDLVVWFMNGLSRTTFAYLSVPRPLDPAWKVVSVADMDGDLKPDVVWQHATSAALAIWRLDGTTVIERVSPAPDRPLDPEWRVVGAADFNRDGRADLLWKHRREGFLVVWMMNGGTQTSVEWLSPGQLLDPRWDVVALGDLSGDGNTDLVFQHPDGQLAVWFLNGVNRMSTRMLEPGAVLDTRWKIAGPK